VGGWADKSGNGYHATQADVNLLPSLQAGAMNGVQPGVRFNGAEGDGMIIDDGLSLSRPYTVFVVNQYNDVGTSRGRTLQARNGPNWLHGLWSGNISSYADGFIGANPAADTNYTYIADTTGTPAGESTFFVNNYDFATDPNPIGEPGNLGLVGGGQFPEYSDADIAEVIVYDRVLNVEELTDLRTHLYTKYEAVDYTPPPPPNPQPTVFAGSVGRFSGGDEGEGLDMSGQFAYAVNVGGPGGAMVGNAIFTDGSNEGATAGVSINPLPSNQIPDWLAPEYGDSANDQGLETVMQSIRWFTPPGLEVDLEVEAGQAYQLQLLFAEQCCDRGFDISLEGEMVVDNFNVQLAQGGINDTSAGAVYSHTFTAGDDVLNIALGGVNQLAPDNNPILNAVTLEVVPEPSSAVLLVLGLLGLLARRRR
jgi:hypothetical protein